MTEDWGGVPREAKDKIDFVTLAERIEAGQPTHFGGPTGKTFVYPNEVKAVVAALRSFAAKSGADTEDVAQRVFACLEGPPRTYTRHEVQAVIRGIPNTVETPRVTMSREALSLIDFVSGSFNKLIKKGKSQIVLEIAFEIEDGAIKSTSKTAKVSVP